MNLILHKIISLFLGDPLIRLIISLGLLIGLLWLDTLLPQSWRIKVGIGVIVFVGALNFNILWGWLKESL